MYTLFPLIRTFCFWIGEMIGRRAGSNKAEDEGGQGRQSFEQRLCRSDRGEIQKLHFATAFWHIRQTSHSYDTDISSSLLSHAYAHALCFPIVLLK